MRLAEKGLTGDRILPIVSFPAAVRRDLVGSYDRPMILALNYNEIYRF
jgi:hypothetical protein